MANWRRATPIFRGPATHTATGANGDAWTFQRSDGTSFLKVIPGHDTIGTGNNVSLDIQNLLGASGGTGRTGFDLLPTSGTLPTSQALTEIVMYRTTDKTTNYERLNIFSGMADYTNDGGWRLGMEAAGTGRLRDIIFAHETGGSWDGTNSVEAGKEDYLNIKAQRVGQSVPIAVQYGHWRFDVASMGGLGSTHYIGRGGGSSFSINVPTGGVTNLSVNNVTQVQVAVNATTITGLTTTDTLRVNVTPTAETPLATHTAAINFNGVAYKVLCLAA